MGRQPFVRKAFASLLLAATAAAQPAFEVASVKANTSGDRSSSSRTGKNSLVLQNWSLERIILKAYGLKGYALTGPDWLASLSFDINAKTEKPVTEAGLREMLQALLVERFGLKAHTALQDKQAKEINAENSGGITHAATEALAIEGVRSGKLTVCQARQMLGIDLCREMDGFLRLMRIAPRHNGADSNR